LTTTNNLPGWVDNRRRALINLGIGLHRTCCASIDTGFNGYLLWEAVPDDFDFGELSSLYEEIEIAGGRSLVALGKSRIRWFDEQPIEIEALFAVSNKRLRSGDPVALVGTALLSGTFLAIDFVEGTVNIRRTG
jgi:hypothetical protein